MQQVGGCGGNRGGGGGGGWGEVGLRLGKGINIALLQPEKQEDIIALYVG